ncbi:superoxide dismutase family protein [Terrisporobacter glycolicus]|uniref:Superoxide dismutase copper/zinc binding domain-containing protein n=1 Tax=Terrisporobacter glycolicus ATCC 14880 = DSM 1288 TaxID=1121315 RepID=A0ABZ2EXA4_9FIRM|nr:superoxide dismutase family protein [Terrisporobacter glycolicus]
MDFPIINNEMIKVFSSYRPNYPTAIANIQGNANNPSLKGEVLFYQLDEGVYIKAYIIGIPNTNSKGEPTKFHGFHIHDIGDCSIGTSQNPFPSTGGHFNPGNNDHPFHAGDLPPILSANGVGILSVFTNNFRVIDILERSIILHENRDDFTSQPSGMSGDKIACGKILPYHY